MSTTNVPAACSLPEAQAYIAALTGSADTPVTFQTFADSGPAKKDGGHGRILHGKVADLWEQLVALNERGHGVFLMVNAGDGRGRKKENVTAARALFIDDDGDAGVPVAFSGDGQPPFDALPPSITVQSSSGQHNYWLLRPGEDLTRFTPAQEHIAAHFRTDPKVKDVCRVMRVPGFLHRKNPEKPVFVRVVQARAATYSIDQVLAAYPALATEKPRPDASSSSSPPPRVDASDVGARASADTLKRAKAYIKKVPPAVEGKHGDEHTFKLCCALARGFTLSDEDALPLLLEWNKLCVPPWGVDDLLKKLQNARVNGEEEIGGRLHSTKAAEHKHVDPVDVVAYLVPIEAYLLRDVRGQWDLSPIKAPKSVAAHLGALGRNLGEIDCILNCPGRMVIAHGLVCAPKDGAVVERDGRRYLNTYKPSSLVPKPGEWPSIRRILMMLTGDDTVGASWLCNWLAAKVQEPALRPQTAVVLHGAQGTGKGTLGQVIARILGEGNCVSISQDDLDGKFNSHYMTKLFVEADEVFTSESLYDRSGFLKHLITDPRIVVNRKNVPQYEVDNSLMWLFTSNSPTPVRVEGEDDRRYTVFCNAAPPTEDYKSFLRSLFGPEGKFTEAMEAEVAAFAHDLLTATVDRAAVGRPYHNRARAELADASKSSAEQFFEEVDVEGIDALLFPHAHVVRETGEVEPASWDHGDQGVQQEAVYEAYARFAKARGFKPVSLSTLTKEMHLHRPMWKKARATGGKARPYLYSGLPRTAGDGRPLDCVSRGSFHPENPPANGR